MTESRRFPSRIRAMRRRDLRSDLFLFGTVLTAVLVLVGVYLQGPAIRHLLDSPFYAPALVVRVQTTGSIALLLAFGIAALYVAYWCNQHRAFSRGWKYAVTHARLEYNVRRALLESDTMLAVQETSGRVTLPRIVIRLPDDDLLTGEILLQSHIRFDSTMEKLNFNPALGRYRVNVQYVTDDGNTWVYEIEDAQADSQLVFNSLSELQASAHEAGSYRLRIDKKVTVPLSHTLLVGATGSGKSYALYSSVLSMLSWTVPPVLYFADPKMSGLGVLGNILAPDRSAVEVEDVIVLLEQFHSAMQERKALMNEYLNSGDLDVDYSKLGLPAHVLLFEEYGAFAAVISTMEKKERDKVNAYMREVIMLGRQLGFWIWVVMQKSDSSDLPTAVRSNLVLKVVLGNASPTTYQTAFEHSADLPKYRFDVGHGLYSLYESQPRPCSFPKLNFSINEAAQIICSGGLPVM